MQLPLSQPQVIREPGKGSDLTGRADPGGLAQQGCDWLRCAAAIARCAANPNPRQCLLDIAPNCIDCL